MITTSFVFRARFAFYAHDPAVILIFNGEQITGWEAISDKQREWWKNGKTDVVYTMKGEPRFSRTHTRACPDHELHALAPHTAQRRIE